MEWSRHTSLCHHNILNHLIAQTYAFHSNVPIGLQWSTDAQKQAGEDCREEDQASNKQVHSYTYIPTIDNAQQE